MNTEMNANQPSYLHIIETGKFKNIINRLYKKLESCTLCPRECKVNRLGNEIGLCGVGKKPKVSSYAPHFGEEKPLVGSCGSGTIFLTGCNLRCVYCQNYEISQLGQGREIDIDELANHMLELQYSGCHNINFVTPTHVVPQIVAAIELAAKAGLRIPLVYNCGGYESVETLNCLNDIFDIYMPDIKYGKNQIAQELSNAKDYPSIVKAAIMEMYKQVGDLVIDADGLAKRGLLIRHLVLPEGIADTELVLSFLAKDISLNTYLNIMDQYRPAFKATQYPPLDRTIQHDEFKAAIKLAHDNDFQRIDSIIG